MCCQGRTEGEHGRREHRRPAAARVRPPGSAAVRPAHLGSQGYLHACLLTEIAVAALVNKEDYFYHLLKHGMQPVHSAEARGTVQVTV